MQRCPACHIRFDHPEADIDVLGRDEILAYWPGQGFNLIHRTTFMCGVCGHVSMEISDIIDIPQALVVSYFAHSPVRRWDE